MAVLCIKLNPNGADNIYIDESLKDAQKILNESKTGWLTVHVEGNERTYNSRFIVNFMEGSDPSKTIEQRPAESPLRNINEADNYVKDPFINATGAASQPVVHPLA